MIDFFNAIRRPLAETLILLLQLAGFTLVFAGLWCIYNPLGLIFAGMWALWFGHGIWLELQRETEDDGR